MSDPILYKYGYRLLNTMKDLPFWLIAGIAIISGILVFLPLNIYIPFKEYWPFVFIAASILTVLKLVNNFSKYLLSTKASAKLRKSFYLIPISHQCFWSISKQSDGSTVTQLISNFSGTNCSQIPVCLVDVRIKKFLMSKKIIDNSIIVDYSNIRRFTTDPAYGDTIYIGQTLPVRVNICIRGKPLRAKMGNPLKIKLCVLDGAGNRQTLLVVFESLVKPKKFKQKLPSEVPSSITDPIEKAIVSVLQLELSHYSKCGRLIGGLGSICTAFPGQISG